MKNLYELLDQGTDDLGNKLSMSIDDQFVWQISLCDTEESHDIALEVSEGNLDVQFTEQELRDAEWLPMNGCFSVLVNGIDTYYVELYQLKKFEG